MLSRKLGKGLESLMGGNSTDTPAVEALQISDIGLDLIAPNPNQPRKSFDEVGLEELANSVKTHGVLQPLIVEPAGNGHFQIIAGERRWRAATLAKLDKVPCLIRQNVSKEQVMELSLIENIQREDLNAIEKAKGYKALMEGFALTQEKVADVVGLSRAAIANTIRLLELPPDIQDSVSRGTITMGHARALLGLTEHARQRALAARIVQEGLSVRETERIVATRGLKKENPPVPPDTGPLQAPTPPEIVEMEEALMRRLGSKVEIKHGPNHSGTIRISYADENDFARIAEIIGASI